MLYAAERCLPVLHVPRCPLHTVCRLLRTYAAAVALQVRGEPGDAPESLPSQALQPRARREYDGMLLECATRYAVQRSIHYV
jgi:hypothetical protein